VRLPLWIGMGDDAPGAVVAELAAAVSSQV
jgi:hypothetical protein